MMTWYMEYPTSNIFNTSSSPIGEEVKKRSDIGEAAKGKTACAARIFSHLRELRVYFNQARADACWNSGKTRKDGFGELYFTMIKLLESGGFDKSNITAVSG